MSSPLKQNTTALQELLDKINQLPEAGSGGGNGWTSILTTSAAGRIPEYDHSVAEFTFNVSNLLTTTAE